MIRTTHFPPISPNAILSFSLYFVLSSKGLSGVEDVPIYRHKEKPPLARPEDLDDELLPRTMALNSGKNANLTPSPNEEIQEEEVKCY